MYLEWCLGLIEAQSSKGFALRQLGYLSLAVEYYRKAIRTHDEVSVRSAVSFLLGASQYDNNNCVVCASSRPRTS
jgi:hypothetical protein